MPIIWLCITLMTEEHRYAKHCIENLARTYQILAFEPCETSGRHQLKINSKKRVKEGKPTQYRHQPNPAHFSSLAFRKYRASHSLDNDDREPNSEQSRAGNGGTGLSELNGSLEPMDTKDRTSPSHLFFPFLQEVQARAPLLGI